MRQLIQRIEDKLSAGFSPAEVFGYFSSTDGVVDIASLIQGIRAVGVKAVPNREEAKALLRQLCSRAMGALTRHNFFDALGVDLTDELYSSKRRPMQSTTRDHLIVSFFNSRPDLKSRISNQLQILFAADTKFFLKLKQVYSRMDVNRSGLVSSVELLRYFNYS